MERRGGDGELRCPGELDGDLERWWMFSSCEARIGVNLEGILLLTMGSIFWRSTKVRGGPEPRENKARARVRRRGGTPAAVEDGRVPDDWLHGFD